MGLLVRVDEVYAVLRAAKPLKATRELALGLLDEALRLNSGSATSFEFKDRLIRRTRDAVGDFVTDDQIADDDVDVDVGISEAARVISKEDAFGLLETEKPRTSGNATAVSLLHAINQLGSAHWTSARDAKRDVISTIKAMMASNQTSSADIDIHHLRETLRSVLVEEMGALKATASLQPATSLSTVVANEIGAEIARAEASRWSAEPLAVMIARYEDEELKNLSGLKHAEDVRKRLANFLDFVGNKPVRDITREDLKDYRDHLDRLPERSNLRLKTNDFRQAIALNETRVHPFPAIGPITVDLKYIGPTRRFFEWLVAEKLIERNPAADIHSSQVVVEAAKSKRLPFKPDQIGRLLATTAGEPRTSALYWLPPMLLFTGARLNELAQLRTDDIRPDYNGRPHISVVCLDNDDDESADDAAKLPKPEDGRGVKSAAARRLIPLHPELLAIGLLRFVASRRERAGADCQLFDELNPDRFGHWSAAISKRINRRIRALGITNKRLTAYSLRHNFRDACVSSGMSDETRMKIMGHQLQGMDAVYGNPLPLPDESASIDRLSFAGVDLSPYHRAGFERG